MKKIRRLLPVLIIICVMAAIIPQFSLKASAASPKKKVTYEYKAVKVKTISKKRSSSPFGSISASPGLTISLTASKSISRTYSNTANIGVTVKQLNAAMGWSNSKSDTVSVSKAAAWKVPSKAKDSKGKTRAVKQGHLKGYTLIETVRYKTMRRTVTTTYPWGLPKIVKGPWKDYKYGTATKADPTHITYIRSFTFAR